MYETARDLSAQLDSKMSALQALVAEADRAAARLDAALSRAAGAGPVADEQARQPSTQAESLQHAPRPDHAPADADRAAARARRQEEIYTLADYGYDLIEIARRVGSPIGEVELILSLRRKG